MKTERPIVKIWNYLRVQKMWDPTYSVNVADLADNTDISRPTVYSNLECLEEMDLIELKNKQNRSSNTLILVNDSLITSSDS